MTSPGAVRLLVGRVGGTAGSLVAGQVVLGVTYIVGARSLAPAGLGIIATCFAISAVAGTVFDLGLNNHLLREVSGGATTTDTARGLIRTKRRAVPGLLVITVAACAAISPDPVAGVVLGLIAWLVWEAQTANALLRAQERFARASGAQLTGRVGGLVLTVALVSAGTDLALPLGLTASFAIEALIDRGFLGRAAAPRGPWPLLAVEQRRAVSFGLTNLAGIGQQLDTPVVAAAAGAAAAGIYAGAGRLLGPLLFLSAAMALVGLPWLARASAGSHGSGEPADPAARDAALRVEERRIARLAAALAVAPLVAGAAGIVVIPFLLGPEYARSGPTFAVLAVGAAISTVNQGLAITLQNRHRDAAVALAIGIGLVLGLVASAVLAALGGPVWAAAGFTVSQLWIVGRLAWVRSQVRAAAVSSVPR